jgi:parvulin-like peptidyl-prolyl isomerase
VRFIYSVFILNAILCLSAVGIFAQETAETVVDEVIAQINDDVITLSQIRREMNFAIESLVQQGKTEEEAREMVEKQKGQLIANIINEELMVQKGKEVGLDKSVEAEINQRFRQQMQENNFKSLDEMFAAMEAQGLKPDDLRRIWRPQIMRELVWTELVDRPLYFEITDKEIKDYYAKYPDKFKKEATVTISEIFLSFAGKDEAAVRAKAAEIVKRARTGEDFATLAVENSERPNVAETKGKAGTFNISQLDKKFAEPLENLKAGDVADPIELVEGMEILRVDERTAASNESSFDEDIVRQAVFRERVNEARRKFMKNLKTDAYIKIRDSYRPIVTPFLNDEEKTEETTAETTVSN